MKRLYTTNCEFCKSHEPGDRLYDYSNWDGGIGFDYIENIKFCPLCGEELHNYDYWLDEVEE